MSAQVKKIGEFGLINRIKKHILGKNRDKEYTIKK